MYKRHNRYPTDDSAISREFYDPFFLGGGGRERGVIANAYYGKSYMFFYFRLNALYTQHRHNSLFFFELKNVFCFFVLFFLTCFLSIFLTIFRLL